MSDTKFLPLKCRIFGHDWFIKTIDEETKPGYVIEGHRPMKCCMRCGEPNPNFPEIEEEIKQ